MPFTQLRILSLAAAGVGDGATVLRLANDVDPRTVDLAGVTRVELEFPKFTDGRAYSQAFALRRRLGFTGDIRATGDVLIDQLVQMQRTCLLYTSDAADE